MFSFPGYRSLEVIHQGRRRAVLRAQRVENSQPVVIKTLLDDYPGLEDLAWFRNEFDLTRRAEADSVVRAYELRQERGSVGLVLEDIGGEALGKLLADRPFPLPSFFDVAIRISEALGRIHAKRIIHKDINPSNIVLNPKSGELRVIDFGISSLLPREDQQVSSPEVIEGTLAYMSPEQTGRMNRGVDWRTDLYSLGATFYQMLTGRPPFETSDLMELVHCHLARAPVPPHALDPAIPPMLSRIVLKLLAKTAEERYRSAHGVAADLAQCRRHWEENGTIPEFETGRDDVAERFQIPQRLYGREAEVEALLRAFDRASAGQSQLLLIKGYAGIGKSSLVSEIHKPVVRERGYFVSGKFDQLQRNQPFASFIRALGDLGRQLLTESDQQLADWRARIFAALDGSGQVMVEAIPELELIIGKQPPVAELPPGPAQVRFHRLFLQLIRVFASDKHPLVLFLDDLQWADSASLDLMQLLLGDTETRGLLLIGAYRDSEVDPSHPLRVALDKLEASGKCESLPLGPLPLPAVVRLIQDTASCDESTAYPLAELVLEKTQGNPFFVNEFLKSLHEESCLSFDRRRGAWTWDLPRIRALRITDNVVELMGGKLRRLPQPTLEVLKLAACIGAEFDLGMLALVHGQPLGQTAEALWAALQAGLVMPQGDAYRLFRAAPAGEQAPMDGERVRFRFLHDRVQQAAYALIDEAQRPEVHLRIGRLLLASPAGAREESRFEVVEHLNRGRSLIPPGEEAARLASLNLAACRKAKLSTAFGPALAYAEAGLSLLGEEGWARDFPQCFRLHVEAMECGYLVGAYARMEALEQVALSRARTVLEQVEVLEIRMKAAMARHKMTEAVDTALRVLPLLGVLLPRSPTRVNLLASLLRVRLLIGRKTPAQLAALPAMTDPAQRAVMRILTTVGHPAFYAAPELIPVVLLKMVEVTVRHGNSPQAPFAWASYGHILNIAFGAAPLAMTYAELGLALLERFQATEYRAKVEFLHTLVRMRVTPWRELLEPCELVYRHALETGDVEYAALGAGMHGYLLFAAGKDLASVEEDITRYQAFFRSAKQERSEQNGRLRHQVTLNLLGRGNPEPWRLVGEQFDEGTEVPRLERAGDKTGTTQVRLYQAWLNYLFDRPREALADVKWVAASVASLNGLVQQAFFYFYQGLILLDVAARVTGRERRALLRQAAAARQALVRWCRYAPANGRHKLALLDAERARVLGRALEASEAYELAISAARESGFLPEEALALERAGRFQAARGHRRVALAYLSDARRAYAAWGAQVKVGQLEFLFPELRQAAASGKEASSGGPHGAETTTHRGSRDMSDALELSSVMKASQAISGEIILPTLLERLLSIVMENAGAERGFILLQIAGELRVEAEGESSFGENDVHVLAGQPVDEAGNAGRLAASVAKYVARTREPVVLEDAAREGLFTRDPYVLSKSPRSVLCAPLVGQGKLSGVVYLENNLITGAFNPQRLEMVKMLSSQAAISIENARLYDNLQQSLDAQIKLTEAQLRFVPREFLQILKVPSIVEVALGDSVRKEMSVLFADIRSFTSLMEGMAALEPIEFINTYLRYMEPAIAEHRGFIDNYIGDAIMALFDHGPDDAVAAGVAMIERLGQLNVERAREGKPRLRIGLGINTGLLTLGTIGAPQRIKCGVMGDSVNLAARIESLTKTYGTGMLISHHTRDKLVNPGRYALRAVDRVTVKGKTQPVTLYEVLDAEEPATRERKLATLSRFTEAVALYYGGELADAERLFQECLALCREDDAAKIYLARCRSYRQAGLPSGWDGVEHLEHK